MPLYCRKCGTRMPPDSLFCPACGIVQTGTDHALTKQSEQDPALLGTGRLPAGRILRQRYRLVQAVGQGGMGAVYAAQDTQLGDRLVAVKEMSMRRLMPEEISQAVEQFQREAYLLASLHHPHLPAIHEYFREDERWYLVMSFIEGRTLQAVLDAAPGNRVPVSEVVRIGIELCEVLDYLHTHDPQIIFRDLKPLNIMLTPKGHICLIDFGIARHFKQDQTKDTAYYHSQGYSPLEQYGHAQTGPRSDIYSLGATLHHMLSGHNPALKPFQFAPLQLVDPTFPVPLAKLIAQMVELNEQARPASVAQIKAQLEHVLAPKQIEPTRQAIGAKKVEFQIEQINAAPHVTPISARSNFQDQTDGFLNKRRLAAWIGFIVLSLTFGCLLPLITYAHNANTYGAINNWPLFVIWGPEERYDPAKTAGTSVPPPYTVLIGAIAVAGLGFLFLCAKKRRHFLDVWGGIALNITAFTYFTFSWYINPSLIYTNFYRFWFFHGLFYSLMNEFIFTALFTLWSFVGIRCFLRSANTPSKLFFGTLLTVIFLVNIIIIAIYTHYFLTTSWPDPQFQPNVFLWIAFLPLGVESLRALIWGTVTLRAALRGRKTKTVP